MSVLSDRDARLRHLLSRRLPPALLDRLRSLRKSAVSVWRRRNLIRLGEFFGTDKWGVHWYLQHYQSHFQPLRRKRLNLLEIGVGGYSDPNSGGNSLRMWKAYFPHANIFGLDICDKRNLEEDRIKIFQGSQIDEDFLRNVVNQIGGIDIVIDDGSHVNQDVIQTFEILFPLLKKPGIYAVEDTQTSYWPGFGGSSHDLTDQGTIMGYFTRLVHSLNHEEILPPDHSPGSFGQDIVAMHFYHNLVVIYKGDNTEGSNILGENDGNARIVFEGYPGPAATHPPERMTGQPIAPHFETPGPPCRK